VIVKPVLPIIASLVAMLLPILANLIAILLPILALLAPIAGRLSIEPGVAGEAIVKRIAALFGSSVRELTSSGALIA
jgi:hypothetical protein